MKPVNIDGLIEQIALCVERHRLETGSYSRWTFGNFEDGTPKNLGRNEYGCADAANILYSIGQFPTGANERAEWVGHLQEMQNPETGLYTESTHHTIHTTAHCTAALELFDTKPYYTCKALEKYTTRECLYHFLEKELDWANRPWNDSHRGAGILPCLTNTDMVGLDWKNWYFDWMWEHSDPDTGFFFCGDEKRAPLFEYMAGGFHYMFNIEAEHRPYRYPEKIIDSCIFLMNETRENGKFHSKCGFIDMDVVYSLNRAMRQSPHRFYEAKQELEKFAEKYVAMMLGLDYKNDPHFNDLHMLFGSVCCLAELQSALPGKLITSKPLKLVLDRRPFI